MLYGGLAVWVLVDGLSRHANGVLWALGTLLLGPIILPIYLAKRPLKMGEVREGGAAWNILKNFALLWTLLMGVVGVVSLVAIGHSTTHLHSSAEQAGAALGTVLGLGFIGALWFFPMLGALVLGLLLKKSSVVERGSTKSGMETSSGTPSTAPTGIRLGVLGWIGLVLCGLILLGGLNFFLTEQHSPSGKNAAATRPTSSATSETAAQKQPHTTTPEQAYLPSVQLTNVQVTEGYGQFDVPGYSARKLAVKATLRNTGNRSLKRVEVTVYFLNSQGQHIAEKEYAPVSEINFSGDAGPLKPNYVKDFGYVVDDVAPSEWAKKIDMAVSKVEFSD